MRAEQLARTRTLTRCLFTLGGQVCCYYGSAQLGSWEKSTTRRERTAAASRTPSSALVLLAPGNFFVNDWKSKMAVSVDARRKWLPREKVMPGKSRRRRRERACHPPIREQSARHCLRPSHALSAHSLRLLCHPTAV